MRTVLICTIIAAVMFSACVSAPPQPKVVELNFTSEIPILVTIETNNCEGNWNFCHAGENNNFKKWK